VRCDICQAAGKLKFYIELTINWLVSFCVICCFNSTLILKT
jgi:hypothetical protein